MLYLCGKHYINVKWVTSQQFPDTNNLLSAVRRDKSLVHAPSPTTTDSPGAPHKKHVQQRCFRHSGERYASPRHDDPAPVISLCISVTPRHVRVPQQTSVEGLWVLRPQIQSVQFARAEAISLVRNGVVLGAVLVREGCHHGDGVLGF